MIVLAASSAPKQKGQAIAHAKIIHEINSKVFVRYAILPNTKRIFVDIQYFFAMESGCKTEKADVVGEHKRHGLLFGFIV